MLRFSRDLSIRNFPEFYESPFFENWFVFQKFWNSWGFWETLMIRKAWWSSELVGVCFFPSKTCMLLPLFFLHQNVLKNWLVFWEIVDRLIGYPKIRKKSKQIYALRHYLETSYLQKFYFALGDNFWRSYIQSVFIFLCFFKVI